MKNFRIAGAVGSAIAALALSSVAAAATLTEDFEAPFPTWESGWFGVNSDAQNCYGVGGGRGNNPDGLWVSNGGCLAAPVNVAFNAGFAATLTSLDLDVAGYSPTTLTIYDKNGATLLSVSVSLTGGAFSTFTESDFATVLAAGSSLAGVTFSTFATAESVFGAWVFAGETVAALSFAGPDFSVFTVSVFATVLPADSFTGFSAFAVTVSTFTMSVLATLLLVDSSFAGGAFSLFVTARSVFDGGLVAATLTGLSFTAGFSAFSFVASAFKVSVFATVLLVDSSLAAGAFSTFAVAEGFSFGDAFSDFAAAFKSSGVTGSARRTNSFGGDVFAAFVSADCSLTFGWTACAFSSRGTNTSWL